MSIDDNVDVIGSSLQNIKNAIEAKGVTPSGNITTYAAAIGQIQGSTPVEIDGVTITKNTNNELQTVGVINDNSGNAVKVWVGTQAEFDAITTKDPSTMYYITDQEEEPVQSERNVGEIVMSTIPLTDAGLHLLDGALLNGDGVYGDFVNYMGGLVADYPDLFVSEADWQTSVSTYGVCGKFVYDSVNNTVRLPKITGIIEGTTDVTALGGLVEAGLPNITGTFNGAGAMDASTGAFNVTSVSNVLVPGNGAFISNESFDASRSSSIYGNSTTVQPQTIKCYYYIVIATSTKTDIQIDIDEVVNDISRIVSNLDTKLDTDGSNIDSAFSTSLVDSLSNNAKSSFSNLAMPSTTYIDLTWSNSATYTAPADGWFIVAGSFGEGGWAVYNTTTMLGNSCFSNSGNQNYGKTATPAAKGQVVQTYFRGGTISNFRFVYAKGSESEA